jgi:hypothetical protein
MSETENLNQEEQAQSQAQPQQPETNDLTINDLNALKTIMDVAISRGAFKGNEMVAIGQTYNKLSGFLDEIAKQSAAAGNTNG